MLTNLKEMKITVFGDDIPCSLAESLPVLQRNLPSPLQDRTDHWPTTTLHLLSTVSHGIYSSIPKTGQKVPSKYWNCVPHYAASNRTGWSGSTSLGQNTTLTGLSHRLPGTLPQLGHNFILPNPCQFIIHTISSKATWSRYWQHH
jgi:hypothetical protein